MSKTTSSTASPGGAGLFQDLLPEMIILLIAGALIGWNAGLFELDANSELFYLAAAKDSIATNHFWVPWLHGHEYLMRSPLWIWLTTLCFKAAGVSVSVARIPAVLCAITGIALTGLLTRTLTENRVALWFSMAMLATTWGFLRLATLSTADVATMDIYLFFFYLVVRWNALAERRAAPQWEMDGLCWMMGGVIGLLLLLKGSLAVVLMGLIGLAYPLYNRNLPLITRLSWIPLFAPAFLMPLPWFIGVAIYSHNAAFGLNYLFSYPIQQLAGLGPWQGLKSDLLFYLRSLPLYLLPYVLFAPFVLLDGRLGRPNSSVTAHAQAVAAQRRIGTTAGGPWEVWALTWFLSGLVIYSLWAFHESTLILPFLPPVAILLGHSLSKTMNTDAANGRLYSNTLMFVIFSLMIGAVLLSAVIFQGLPANFVSGFWQFPGTANIDALHIGDHQIDLAESFPVWKFWLTPGPFILLAGGLSLFILQAVRRTAFTVPATILTFALFFFFVKIIGLPILHRPVALTIVQNLISQAHKGDQVLLYSQHPDLKRVWFYIPSDKQYQVRFTGHKPSALSSKMANANTLSCPPFSPTRDIEETVEASKMGSEAVFGIAREEAFYNDFNPNLREQLQILFHSWVWKPAEDSQALKLLIVHPPQFNRMRSGLMLFRKTPEIAEDLTLLMPGEEPVKKKKRRRR